MLVALMNLSLQPRLNGALQSVLEYHGTGWGLETSPPVRGYWGCSVDMAVQIVVELRGRVPIDYFGRPPALYNFPIGRTEGARTAPPVR